jgi:hypothetical protein
MCNNDSQRSRRVRMKKGMQGGWIEDINTLLEGISYRVPQHSGGFLSRAYSNLLYIS